MFTKFYRLHAAAFLTIIFFSCKHDNVVITPARTDIHLDSNAAVGKHIVDKDGKSLYYFANDADGQSACTGGCLTTWPVFYADSATTTYTGGLSSGDFKTITTAGGVKQTAYKGWPLYYYAPGGMPEAAGETKGEGTGNVWFVAKTNYSITIANFQLTGANATNYLSNYTPGNGRTSYLCDERGNTLYSFARDSAFKNKYTRPDFSNNATWPIYEMENITVPSTLDKTLFVVTTFNGRKQLTYKGWPLYYYGADGFVRGVNKGITIPATQPAGAVWPVAIPSAVLAPR
jgi:predicted lipoprotein with Yx(FWY)xxD motif